MQSHQYTQTSMFSQTKTRYETHDIGRAMHFPARRPESFWHQRSMLQMAALAFIAVAALSGCRPGTMRLAPEPNQIAVRPYLIPTFTPLPPATATLTPFPSATPYMPYATPTPDRFERAGLPVRLEIPAIGVSALVEHVGRLPNGHMDVPRVPEDVAWFDESALPGQHTTSTSIISGHLDSPAGPAVFYRLRMLVPGDEMVVTYASGDSYVFVVEEKERYYHDQPPYQKLYGDGETVGRRLNLITCDGAWDRGSANYQQRLVVYTHMREDGLVEQDDSPAGSARLTPRALAPGSPLAAGARSVP